MLQIQIQIGNTEESHTARNSLIAPTYEGATVPANGQLQILSLKLYSDNVPICTNESITK